MTGQEFIDTLECKIMERGKLDEEYTPADLTLDAAAAGLWYRKPLTLTEQQEMQEQDLTAARMETSQLDKAGDSHEPSH